MHVMSQNGKIVINTEYVDHYSIGVKSDAVLVVAGCHGGQPVTMGRYKDEKEACGALGQLYAALVGGQDGFYMPESTLFAEMQEAKDARVRRKGGS